MYSFQAREALGDCLGVYCETSLIHTSCRYAFPLPSVVVFTGANLQYSYCTRYLRSPIYPAPSLYPSFCPERMCVDKQGTTIYGYTISHFILIIYLLFHLWLECKGAVDTCPPQHCCLYFQVTLWRVFLATEGRSFQGRRWPTSFLNSNRLFFFRVYCIPYIIRYGNYSGVGLRQEWSSSGLS